MISPFSSVPLLGTLLRTYRQQQTLSVKQLAQKFGLSLDRMRSLEQDASLPTADELSQLAHGLSQAPHRLFRSVQKSALRLLDEALHPDALTEAIAARPVIHGPDVSTDAVLLLPVTLRMAVCDALTVRRDDDAALQAAWTTLAAETATQQRIALEATVAQLTLEGDEPEEPLFPC